MPRTSRRARKNSPLRLTPAFELFSKSRVLVTDNLGIFAALYLLPFIFLLNSWMVNTHTLHGRAHWQWFFQNRSAGWSGPFLPSYAWGYLLSFAIWGLATVALSFLVQILSQAAQFDVTHHGKVTFSRIWRLTREVGWQMIGLYILVGLTIAIGLIFLIIPGLIMLRRYFLAPYVMLDQKVGVREAMNRSAELSVRDSGAVWGVIGVMFLIGLVNILPVFGGLIAFILGALYSVAPALRYRELKRFEG